MEEQESRRVFAFILEAGVKLGCEDETAATAAVLTHRFFQKLPPDMGAICPFSLATAALYLAGKVQEDFIKIRDAINVAYACLHSEEEAMEVGELYWAMRDGIGALELLLSRTLAFHLNFHHPHIFLSQYLDSLRSWLRREDWDTVPIAQTAMTILRDSYIIPQLPTSVPPQLYALACLSTTLDVYGIQVPFASSVDPTPWWSVLYPETDAREVNALSTRILTKVYADS